MFTRPGRIPLLLSATLTLLGAAAVLVPSGAASAARAFPSRCTPPTVPSRSRPGPPRSCRCRRRPPRCSTPSVPAARSRRSTSTPTTRPACRAPSSTAPTPTWRRSRPTSPTWCWPRTRRPASTRSCAPSASRSSASRRPPTCPRSTRSSPSSAGSPATRQRPAPRWAPSSTRSRGSWRRSTKPARHETYYYELDQTYYSATSSTFIGQLLGLLGLHSIADAAKGAAANGGYPQLSGEFILKADPDYILLADTICCGQSAATVAGRPGWSGLAAVTHGRVLGLDDDIASRWGPRVVDLLAAVAAEVRAHPAGGTS